MFICTLQINSDASFDGLSTECVSKLSENLRKLLGMAFNDEFYEIAPEREPSSSSIYLDSVQGKPLAGADERTHNGQLFCPFAPIDWNHCSSLQKGTVDFESKKYGLHLVRNNSLVYVEGGIHTMQMLMYWVCQVDVEFKGNIRVWQLGKDADDESLLSHPIKGWIVELPASNLLMLLMWVDEIDLKAPTPLNVLQLLSTGPIAPDVIILGHTSRRSIVSNESGVTDSGDDQRYDSRPTRHHVAVKQFPGARVVIPRKPIVSSVVLCPPGELPNCAKAKSAADSELCLSSGLLVMDTIVLAAEVIDASHRSSVSINELSPLSSTGNDYESRVNGNGTEEFPQIVPYRWYSTNDSLSVPLIECLGTGTESTTSGVGIRSRLASDNKACVMSALIDVFGSAKFLSELNDFRFVEHMIRREFEGNHINMTWADVNDAVMAGGHRFCGVARDRWVCAGAAYTATLKETPVFDADACGMHLLPNETVSLTISIQFAHYEVR